MSKSIRREFAFKSKTLDGRAAKFEVVVYDKESTVKILKVVFSKEDIPGYKLFRKFKWGNVMTEQLLIKKSSLFMICREVFSTQNDK